MEIEPQRRAALYAALNRLQSALQGAELWEDERPGDRELQSQQPFCYDTLMLHQWLQWRFIPRLRGILDRNGKLPDTCAIYPYAEEFFDSDNVHRGELLRAILRLDELINSPAAGAVH